MMQNAGLNRSFGQDIHAYTLDGHAQARGTDRCARSLVNELDAYSIESVTWWGLPSQIASSCFWVAAAAAV